MNLRPHTRLIICLIAVIFAFGSSTDFAFGANAQPKPRTSTQKKQAKKTLWIDEALRLTGESDFVRERSLQRLKARPQLKAELRSGLVGSHRALAIDVIVALKLKEFLPDLMKLSRDDRDGFMHFAIYALTDNQARAQVAAELKSRLSEQGGRKLSAGAKVAILDILSLWRERLAHEDLLWLLRDESPEVRMASVAFAKSYLLHSKNEGYAQVIEQAAKSQPYQLRLRAYYAVAEIPKQNRASLQRILTDCSRDQRIEVRSSCPTIPKGAL